MRDHDSDCYCGRCREDRADNPSATVQSKTPRTPRTDEESSLAYLFPSRCEVVHTYFARTLETELQTALAERDEARETLDLMCDEFQRIKALAGLPLEAHTFCERAISGIKQRVPLIEQRDKAEKERDEARRLAAKLQSALDAGPCECDGRYICERCHILGKTKSPTT